MLIEVSNTLTVENPTPEMVLWCKRNLTIPNPEYAKKSRMNLWLGNTPKVLSLYETRGTTLVLPFGTLRLLPKDISDKALFLSEFAAPVEVNFNADVPLYDYQETAVQAMVAAQYGILQSAAGSGKTQMGIALAARLGRRTLWLCHTLDLIKQSKERAKLYMSEDLMGTITEGKVNLGEGITFATIQTMCKLDLAQYRDYWDCIITDEVHRVSGSPNWKVRIKNKSFWIALIPAVLLLVQVIAAVFGYTLDLGELGDKLLAVVNALFAVLTILGIVTDPTTAGIGDSKQALTYETPKKEDEV